MKPLSDEETAGAKRMIREMVDFKGKNEHICPPMLVTTFGTANNRNTKQVILAYHIGMVMAGALVLPAEDVDKLCECLKDSARKALRGDKDEEALN